MHEAGLRSTIVRVGFRGDSVKPPYLAHHSHPPHPELSEWARARGYEVAYDGLAVDV